MSQKCVARTEIKEAVESGSVQPETSEGVVMVIKGKEWAIPEGMLRFFLLIAGIVGGVALNAFTLGRSIATVNYVDSKHKEGIDYTDNKSRETLDRAFAHSDFNRAELMIEIKSQSADVKAVSAKQDILLDSVRTLSTNQTQDQRENRRR